jgi:hypothetical protein
MPDDFTTDDPLVPADEPIEDEEEDTDDGEPIPLSQLPEEDGGEPLEEDEDEDEIELGNEDEIENF